MRWTFGVEPLPQIIPFASLIRRVTGLVLSLETPQAAVERLTAALGRAEEELRRLVPGSAAPRIGRQAASDGRVYIDHSRDIGDYNPCFPIYQIHVNGERASGTVEFPIVYEGPPGIVHGGFLALFFDSIVQHHNCDLGLAGKTRSLTVTYWKPTPLLSELQFEVDRCVAEGRIDSTARLLAGGVLLCEAQVRAIAGDHAALPEVSPRRSGA